MKLCFVSVNGPREPYLLDEPRILLHAGFEVLTVEAVKSSIFWDIMPCSLIKVNQDCGGKYCPDLKGQRRCGKVCAKMKFKIFTYSALGAVMVPQHFVSHRLSSFHAFQFPNLESSVQEITF
jgi:hypothetical protein